MARIGLWLADKHRADSEPYRVRTDARDGYWSRCEPFAHLFQSKPSTNLRLTLDVGRLHGGEDVLEVGAARLRQGAQWLPLEVRDRDERPAQRTDLSV